MRLDFFGIVFDSPGATFYMWSPWRCSDLENRVFKSVVTATGLPLEKEPDETRLHVTDAKQWKAAMTAVSRVLKGWQEDAADTGTERRAWRWLLEADTDADGYDHLGERTGMWGFLRVALDRTSPGEDPKAEEIDLNGFGVRIWGEQSGKRPR